ncbi:LSM domain-containing protein [Haloferax sp. S1W]|uniref:LSM domain-containing protein n=1 Tax=Haloferax sp. S1W TaxID=3377110 RepID=UPI0037C91C24
MSGRPLDVLEDSLDEPVTVTLKDESAYYGVLAGYDQHMNVVLEESLDDSVPGDVELEQVQDTTIIRGDNVVTIKA